MKSIYILLTESDTYISKIIKLLTNDKYTHASISFDSSLQPLYSFSRKFVNMPLPAGLQNESLTTGFYLKYRYIPCALYELEVEDEIYYRAKKEVEKMMDEAKDYHFNVIGLILCKLNIPFHRNNCYFCSEFVSDVLNKSKALVLPKDTSLMRPNDYTNISQLSCQFEGRLYHLVQGLSFQVKYGKQLSIR